MAIYSLNVSVISRKQGYTTTAAAAYRARTVILDERTGQTHDYSRMKNEALFTGIFAPKDAPAWARDRQQLWNTVEQSEKRKDARLARDLKIALPHELTVEQNRWLVQDFVQPLTRKGYVADVAIHAPSAEGDERNVHVHILLTDRVITPDGFAPTKDRSIQSKEHLQELRQSWEKLANHHLQRHGHAARIDHRSLTDQGMVHRAPTVKMGKAATQMERRGVMSERGEQNNAIKTHNRRAEELLRELAELQQQEGIAAQFKENAVAWYDRAFHTFESLAAAPFGFIFGNDQSPEQYYRDPDKANTTEINIRTDAVNIQTTAPVVEQAQEMQPVEAIQEAAPQQEAPTAQAALQEQIAQEKAYYEAQAQEMQQGQEREQEYAR